MMAVININRDPSAKDLLWFGVLLAIFIGVVGALVRVEAPEAARVVWSAGGALVVVYALMPPLRRWVYLGWMYAAFPIGWTVSHVLLAAIYFLVFTPIGLLLRLGRGDPLERRFDRSAATYWAEHRPGADVRRYFRQFWT